MSFGAFIYFDYVFLIFWYSNLFLLLLLMETSSIFVYVCRLPYVISIIPACYFSWKYDKRRSLVLSFVLDTKTKRVGLSCIGYDKHDVSRVRELILFTLQYVRKHFCLPHWNRDEKQNKTKQSTHSRTHTLSKRYSIKIYYSICFNNSVFLVILVNIWNWNQIVYTSCAAVK